MITRTNDTNNNNKKSSNIFFFFEANVLSYLSSLMLFATHWNSKHLKMLWIFFVVVRLIEWCNLKRQHTHIHTNTFKSTLAWYHVCLQDELTEIFLSNVFLFCCLFLRFLVEKGNYIILNEKKKTFYKQNFFSTELSISSSTELQHRGKIINFSEIDKEIFNEN